MKRLSFLILFFGLIIWGCGQQDKSNTDKGIKISDQAKTEFENDVNTRLKAYKVDIVQMKLDKDKLEKASKEYYEPLIKDAGDKVINLENKFKSLQSAEDTTWFRLKNEIKADLESLDVQVDTTKLNLIRDLQK